MEPQLGHAKFLFFQNNNWYEVMFVTFEDGTHSVFCFKLSPTQEDKKSIGTFDTEERNPNSILALDFLKQSLGNVAR